MTPKTLARIRTLAVTCVASRIADDLGWDVARVIRVARDHNIEVRDSLVAPASVLTSHPLLPTYDAGSSLTDIFDKLPNVHVRVLRMLSAVDGFVSANRIAECTGMSRETVVRSLPQIERTLEGTRWRILSMARRNGGHRLVELVS